MSDNSMLGMSDRGVTGAKYNSFRQFGGTDETGEGRVATVDVCFWENDAEIRVNDTPITSFTH